MNYRSDAIKEFFTIYSFIDNKTCETKTSYSPQQAIRINVEDFRAIVSQHHIGIRYAQNYCRPLQLQSYTSSYIVGYIYRYIRVTAALAAI